MRISEFDYKLPKNLIAQKPISPRDHSRLMIVDRKTGQISHHHFYDILKLLKKGDVLVLNDSKVIPARLWGRRESGGKAEVLLLRPKAKNLKNYVWSEEWWVIARPGLALNQIITFPAGLKAEVFKINGYERLVRFNYRGEKLKKIIYRIGQAPVPPYIKTGISGSQLKKEYQTVYARYLGSVAAPTAGFHFTPKLIGKLKAKGIRFQYVTLHVGLGTFQPVKEEKIENHKMSVEWAEVNNKTAAFLNGAKKQGRRIIAVGTTATRVLESAANETRIIRPGQKFVDLFIYPGYKFKIVDALITNFHLPKSTLLLLVSAFAGRNLILASYQKAIKNKYRFFSFGDAMFIQ
ncbi:MAG TPA: tRNA preQ1(34) S-adenosylmethionine ribosyltransferase-isomerase QueA [Candidatus Paceibacterota bacterium]|nr:tRNA preQ1(34) S-adenosylmethionine ribosyltransferase-isomerase QueA [Candidatus Paceibacterota bacterium]HRY76587.1 tRNA preQ1(34) S-adenosylmethionine ribosyltransferase-isomerase QueA [Candidatus Paceibacterota bacterium]